MRSRLCFLAAAVAAASCGGKAPTPAAAPTPGGPSAAASGSASSAAHAPAIAGVPAGSKPVLHHMVTPSRLLPEIVGKKGFVATEDGAARYLVDRMRLVVRSDGSLDRAAELLPMGNVASIALPSRLGGGYLFHVNAGSGTEIWRASGWLGKLQPLTRRNEVVSDIVPGFDRLYVRLTTGNRMIALDQRTGEPMGLGPLPIAASYGMLAFADGWRAVVDTDLRGPLTTFDAGTTWRPVSVPERSAGVGVVDGNPAVLVSGGRYVIDAHGSVTYRTTEGSGSHADEAPGAGEPVRPSPLGRRALRAAVEDGWPETDTTAVVARGGAIARVSLRDGAVLALVEDAYPERRSTCHAVRLGLHGVGFVCGEREGPTTIYEHVPPLGMKLVLRYEKPRFVSASGNGALVVRGRCAGDAGPSDEAEARWYCIRAPGGGLREIRVKGFDLGVERVVALGDGRVAVIVPPRGGSPGALSIISGSTTASVPLELPAEPRGAAHELKRGMWLDGFEERQPGVLGGWVEAGGPFVGIEITLDGKVKAGELRDEPGGALYAGRFAVALGDGGHAFETSDGGMTWAAFDLPERDDEARAVPSRGCGPVGCALPGWVRVGWGDPETADDMKPAETPSAPYVPFKISPALAFDCAVTSTSTPPLPDKPRAAVAAAPRPPVRSSHRITAGFVPRPVVSREMPTPWAPFRNQDPPPLAADDFGVDNGPGTNEAVLLRVYAWGKRASDWTRNGRWLVRFDDRFDPAGGVRQSALTTSLWAHDTEAVEAIGTGPYQGTQWRGYLDASGRSLLAAACHGSLCAMYSVGEGQPVLPLRSPTGSFMRPFDGAAVRVGETWFFLSQTPSYDGVTLWRADLGVARVLGTYHRAAPRYGFEMPQLTRRARGSGIGLLVGGPPEPGEKQGTWYVIPVDPETGVLGEATALVRRDFVRSGLLPCAPDQDGWVLDVSPAPDTPTTVDTDNARAQIESVEMRVRIDPGRSCIEGAAARSAYFYAIEPQGGARGPVKPLTAPPARKGPAGDEPTVPMAVTEKNTGRRWGLTCKLKKR